jgi:hypothetical protein
MEDHRLKGGNPPIGSAFSDVLPMEDHRLKGGNPIALAFLSQQDIRAEFNSMESTRIKYLLRNKLLKTLKIQ